jgi:hypothetical protein
VIAGSPAFTELGSETQGVDVFSAHGVVDVSEGLSEQGAGRMGDRRRA